MLNVFEKKVLKTCQKFNMLQKGDSIVIGLSGGADSVCLLSFLCSVKDIFNLNLCAVHVNHGIRGDEATRDMEFSKKICKTFGVDFIMKCYDVKKIANEKKISHELAGRNARYEAFNSVLEEKGANKIAVAHNKNDFAETMLINFTRGCSLNGLKGISPVNGKIIRPLIETERNEIENYLSEKGLTYVNDSTNSESIYTRNIFRNEIIPLINKINPNFINTVYNSSTLLAECDDFIKEEVKFYTQKAMNIQKNKVILDKNAIKDLHICLKKHIIFNAVSHLKGDKSDIEQKHIDIILNSDKTGKRYNIGNNIVVSQEYDKLIFAYNEKENFDDYLIEITDINNEYKLNNQCIKFEICGNTFKREKNHTYIDYDLIKDKKLIVRNRREGDKFIPSGMKGEKKLKNYFIDCKISRSERNKIPILCANDEIVAILGYRVSNNYIVSDKTNKILKISLFGGTND